VRAHEGSKEFQRCLSEANGVTLYSKKEGKTKKAAKSENTT
jgi:hypothetical protein